MTPLQSSSFQYIDTDAGLKALIIQLDQAERVAIDTEADSLHHYFEKVCLIQLSFHGHDYLIDPLSKIDLSNFLDVLSTKSLIIHGADYDLRMLRTSFGFRPQCEVFDTMLAAQMLGYEQFGLAALIQRYLDTTVTKQGQKSDWSLRPLSPMQLDYAYTDTRFLETIANRMGAELDTVGRCEWHRETCKAMVISTERDTQRDPDDAWRIKHIGQLTRQQLAFLRELWHWRDQEARQADRPPFKILNNQHLFALTTLAGSQTDQPLTNDAQLPRHINGRRLELLKAAIQKAAALPEHEWPQQKKRIKSKHAGPNDVQDIDALRDACSKIAKELGITASVLAPRAAIKSIICAGAKTMEEIMAHGPLLRWQATLLEPAVTRIILAREQREKSQNVVTAAPMPSSPPPAIDVTEP
ncbi:MAG TPA: hypothetical protein EYG58_00255 [Nitrospirales bacterium]|nr:hypothetical protein [Nitrospirales bacterium]